MNIMQKSNLAFAFCFIYTLLSAQNLVIDSFGLTNEALEANVKKNRNKESYKVLFDHNSWEIDEKGFSVMDEIFSQLKQDASLQIHIIGHADKTGDDTRNRRLSERRAKAVRNRFRTMGIANDRMHASAVGSTQNTSSNKTEEGRRQNRKVEIRFVD